MSEHESGRHPLAFSTRSLFALSVVTAMIITVLPFGFIPFVVSTLAAGAVIGGRFGYRIESSDYGATAIGAGIGAAISVLIAISFASLNGEFRESIQSLNPDHVQYTEEHPHSSFTSAVVIHTGIYLIPASCLGAVIGIGMWYASRVTPPWRSRD